MHSASNHDIEASKKEGYEITDMNTRLVAYFIAGLFALMFGAVVTIIIVLRGFNQSVPPLNQTPASALATAGMQVPDAPRLQQDPVKDRKEIVGAQQHQVNSYGMVSEEPGMERAHIPVGEAMQRVAEGKAYRQEPKPAALEPADPFADSAL